MVWRPDGPEGFESRKIAPFIVPYTRGRGLDLGCGLEKAWPHMIGVDTGQTYGARRDGRGVDVFGDIRKLDWCGSETMDFVFSSHALEDLADTRAALAEWWRVVKPGGYLILYLPHRDLYPNVGQPGANPAHQHDFVNADITLHMRELAESTRRGWVLVEDEVRGERDEYSFFQVYRKAETPETTIDPWRKPDKALLIIRYGGFGDMMMLSSALPALKRQGWHITVNTTPQALQAIAHDPNIDAFWLQDRDQVPNSVLGPYWFRIAERFDKVINLCESVEGTLLGHVDKIAGQWGKAARHAVMDVNYYERTHDLCEVEHDFQPRFYPTAEEDDRARKDLWNAGKGRPVIVWALVGSSVHKRWPHVDRVLANLMMHTQAAVIMVGDELSGILAAGWENEKRVTNACGKWDIRRTLAVARRAALVVGPETGVLNAVSHEPDVAKVVLLSHSSVENLTKHWLWTRSIVPKDTPCHPCHLMHYSFEGCRRHPDPEIAGASLCAGNTDPYDVYVAIAEMLNERLTRGRAA